MNWGSVIASITEETVYKHLRFIDVIERELRGLPETARHFGVDTVMMITMNDDKTFNKKGVRVNVVPAWKWLIDMS